MRKLTEQERLERVKYLRAYRRDWARAKRLSDPDFNARQLAANRKQREKRRLLNPPNPTGRQRIYTEDQRKEKRLESLRKYNAANKHKERAYYLRNAEKIKQRSRDNGKSERGKELRKLASSQRKERDENYRILCKLRSSIGTTIKRYTGRKKSNKTTALIGCSIEFFRGWIESKFQPGMTWANHGKHTWHIDHRIPCAEFDLRDPEQQKQCYHYTNLQPLWALDNLRKGDKIIYEREQHNFTRVERGEIPRRAGFGLMYHA